MPDYKYLIVGGGMTADAAVKGIRARDSRGTIGMLAAEPRPPYKRPPLSKALWKGEPEESIWLNTGAAGVTIHSGCAAGRLDLKDARVTDTAGASYRYEKLLLATGGRVRRLPFDADGIVYYRTFDDYQALQHLKGETHEVVVIGGGFIGSEIAAALAMHKTRVTMVFPGRGIGAGLYPGGLSTFLDAHYRAKGVAILAGDAVTGIRRQEGKFLVTTQSGRTLRADGVVAGIGIEPETSLAVQAGLRTGDGIEVDEQLRTVHPDVYAAGDVASFYNPALDRRLRVEHEDNAVTMGGHAGRNMAGDASPYHHLPFFFPTSSSSAMRPSAKPIPASKWSNSGKRSTRRAWCTI